MNAQGHRCASRRGCRRCRARELLEVLTRPDDGRAALIGRLHQRVDASWLVEMLMDLEELNLRGCDSWRRYRTSSRDGR